MSAQMTTDLLGIAAQFSSHLEPSHTLAQSSRSDTTNIRASDTMQPLQSNLSDGIKASHVLLYEREVWRYLHDENSIENDPLGVGAQFAEHNAL
jgi:hypothetical protein